MREKDFNRLYAEHAQRLYGFLSYRTGDSVLAEDLLADTFERVLRARKGYDPQQASERTWLYAIALNAVRDTARRAAAETRALARAGTGSELGAGEDLTWAEGVDRRDALRAALEVLGEREREAVALRYGADLSLVDVAAVIGEPRSTAESRIYAGLRKLREALGDDFTLK